MIKVCNVSAMKGIFCLTVSTYKTGWLPFIFTLQALKDTIKQLPVVITGKQAHYTSAHWQVFVHLHH